jgi:Flp pilus assembly protein TadD
VDALIALGRPREALALLEAAAPAPSPAVLKLRGRALRALGRHFDAEQAFRDALAGAPQDAALLADLATTLLAQCRSEEARLLAGQACGLRPDVAAWHCLRGVAADGAGASAEAAQAFAAARALAPEDAHVHAMIGWHALRDGHSDEAARAFREALAIDPSCAEALRGVARAKLLRDDWEGARASWLESLALDPLQRDRALGRALQLGTSGLRPFRTLANVPLRTSALLGTLGAVAIAIYARVPGAILLGSSLGLLAAAPPLARLALARYARTPEPP